MIPKVILHNSISIDGSLTGFEPNMGLHYRLAGSFNPDIHLIGSNTIRQGIELYGEGMPPEEENDFKKPDRKNDLPYWVIIDTKGILQGMLHTCRRFEFCKDVIIVVSETTSQSYLDHLKKREYNWHIAGKEHADLKKVLKILSDTYKAKTVLTDTGRILGNLLINQDLVDVISLLIHPVIVGNESYNMFAEIERKPKLKLFKQELLEEEYIWLVYNPLMK
jgi:2,5-diamino-6-(ribosylamino)-4(3H)-pyrimidinone 5'-phosphate reductase